MTVSRQSRQEAFGKVRTRNRLEGIKQHWRDQVIFDRTLSGLTKAVAYAMANWIVSTETRAQFELDGIIVVRGAQRILAHMLGCSPRTVHLAMTNLMENGHLALVCRPQGRDDTNHYRIIPKAETFDRRSARTSIAAFEHGAQLR